MSEAFTLKNIINVLSDVGFCSADWDALGVQLEVRSNQLNTITANYANVDQRLMHVISQWMRSDNDASWESLAEALSKITSYGPATSTRLRRAAGIAGGPIPDIGVTNKKESTGQWMAWMLITAFGLIALWYVSPWTTSAMGTFISSWLAPSESGAAKYDDRVCTKIRQIEGTFGELKEFSKWRLLGTELGISENAMGVIENDNPNTEMKKRALLKMWFEGKEEVCWEDIVAALRSLDQIKLAKAIADKHQLTWKKN